MNIYCKIKCGIWALHVVERELWVRHNFFLFLFFWQRWGRENLLASCAMPLKELMFIPKHNPKAKHAGPWLVLLSKVVHNPIVFLDFRMQNISIIWAFIVAYIRWEYYTHIDRYIETYIVEEHHTLSVNLFFFFIRERGERERASQNKL